MMIFFVSPQRPGITVALSTPLHMTGKGFGTPMGQQMTIQMVLPLEGFATNVTVVPSLFTVS